MCGITGFIDLSAASSAEALEHVVQRMASAIRHRGPDDSGTWVNGADGVALGHRRLSIIDLSPAGHQPMVSACGRYVMVFNGEIYNYEDVRAELRREMGGSLPMFRGHSDTEVMLAAFSHWGIRESLERFNGMFAFAVWDLKDKALTLARDRLGEKPLYYGVVGGTFLFGSELKALMEHPLFVRDIDRDVLTLFFRFGYIPSPYCIFRGIHKLPQASFLTIGLDALKAGRTISPFPEKPDATARDCPRYYWFPREIALRMRSASFRGTEREAADRLEELLRDSIALRMVADVPVGAFLSGGIDSSTVVALMQAQSSRPVMTFSIGFHEPGMNEADHAMAVAKHLRTDHTELYVTPTETRDVIPRLPDLYDEPFADSSQIPTFLVSELARRHVTVSLSGDGGDELLGGYERYALSLEMWKRIRRIPWMVRALGSRAVTAIPPEILNATCGWLKPIIRRYVRSSDSPVGQTLHRIAEVSPARTPQELYVNPLSHWTEPCSLVPGTSEPLTAVTDPAQWPDLGGFAAWMMFVDAVSYLPDDILVKVDRASMGVSLESRVPFLDHRLVEFAWSLPLSVKMRNGKGKWLLRQVLYRHVPESLVERPKMGFGVPIDVWLRGPLREWGESLLDEARLSREGFLDPKAVRTKWREHVTGARNWQYLLWDVLMFQAWLNRYFP